MEVKFVSDTINDAGFKVFWYSTAGIDGLNGMARKNNNTYSLKRVDSVVNVENLKKPEDKTTINV
jgi:hypothetical protein